MDLLFKFDNCHQKHQCSQGYKGYGNCHVFGALSISLLCHGLDATRSSDSPDLLSADLLTQGDLRTIHYFSDLDCNVISGMNMVSETLVLDRAHHRGKQKLQ